MRRKTIPIFALQVALLVLAAAWVPGVKKAYPKFFHVQANYLFNVFGEERVVRLSRPEKGSGSDTKMAGFERGRFEPRFSAQFKIFERGYWSLVGVAALVIATPLALPQRMLALIVGMLLINGVTLLQVASVAFTSYGVAAGGEGVETWRRASNAAQGIFNSEIPRIITVSLVWVLVARPAKVLEMGTLPARIQEWMRRRGGRGSPRQDDGSRRDEGPKD